MVNALHSSFSSTHWWQKLPSKVLDHQEQREVHCLAQGHFSTSEPQSPHEELSGKYTDCRFKTKHCKTPYSMCWKYFILSFIYSTLCFYLNQTTDSVSIFAVTRKTESTSFHFSLLALKSVNVTQLHPNKQLAESAGGALRGITGMAGSSVRDQLCKDRRLRLKSFTHRKQRKITIRKNTPVIFTSNVTQKCNSISKKWFHIQWWSDCT